MRRVLWSLLWKEWREQRWLLGFSSLLMAAVLALGLRARLIEDEALVWRACLAGSLLLPVLAAGGLVPAERAEGGLRVLSALPVRRWQVLAVKAGAGVVLCVGPMAAGAAVSVAMAGGREMAAQAMLRLFAASAAAGVSLFAWMFALTVRQHAETLAWMLSVGVLIGWGCASVAIELKTFPSQLRYASPYVFLYLDPVVSADGGRLASTGSGVAIAAAVQAAVAAGLWAAAAALFTRSSEGRP